MKDAGEFAKKAIEKCVAFVPGAPFYAGNPDVAKIEEGVGRLGRAV
jgi:hypothetical protein